MNLGKNQQSSQMQIQMTAQNSRSILTIGPLDLELFLKIVPILSKYPGNAV